MRNVRSQTVAEATGPEGVYRPKTELAGVTVGTPFKF